MSDVLLRGVRAYGGGDPLDVLVRDGLIAGIAPAGTLEPAGAEVVRADGRFVGPGLWDAHVHFTQWLIRRRRIDLSPARSAAETLRIVERALTDRDGDGPVIGYGFRDGLWEDTPTQESIDRVARGAAVVLVSGDLHCGWLSTAGAHWLGLEPDAGGMVREGAWIGAKRGTREAEALSPADVREAVDDAARRGVVGIVDFENDDLASIWPRRVTEGADALRVEISVWPERLEEAIAVGRRTGDGVDGSGLVTMGPLKVVVDGSLNTRTAWCWDPYPGSEGGDGVVSTTPQELRRLLSRARSHGIDAAVHAIGDRANSEVLDAFEDLGMSGTIEHAQFLREDDAPRFAALGVVAGVQPEHAMDDRDIADRHWSGRTGRAFAFGTLHRAGAALRLGSDAPVAPLDPWHAIAAVVARARDDRAPWHPEQRIPVDAALASSARTSFAEGEPADLVVLDADPLAAEPAALRTMGVAATLVGGRFTWRDL